MLKGIFVVILAFLPLLALMPGCSSEAVQAINQKSKIDAAQAAADARVTLAQADAQAKIKAAQAEADPLRHSLAATTQVMKRVRAFAIAVFFVAFLSLGVAIGVVAYEHGSLTITKLWLFVSASVTGLSFTLAVLTPFFWFILGGALIGSATLLIVESVRAKSLAGGVKTIVNAVEKAV